MAAVDFKDAELFRDQVIDEIKTSFHLEESQALAIFQVERTTISDYWHQHATRNDGNIQELVNLMLADEDDLEDDCRE
ncbi:hypothetical protein [Lapidilactobacillus bayanensis]|uniref:hypothetical protein n=1 Tax=Lapidilactobacillus bayanensis TaxID=2485998 RepID=UPI000F78F12E|nr:hypothetical protein [Lapidilactobacillus bayanensis]